MARFKGLGIACLLVVATVFALAGCSSTSSKENPKIAPQTSTVASSTAPQSGHALVTITETGFDPAVVTVTAHTKVIWTNGGKQPHDITPDGGGPKSGKMKPGVTAMHQFDSVGTFSYHDSLHPSLKGKVIVR